MCQTIEKAFEVTCSKDINGIKTEFVKQSFANKVLIVITQHEKMCNIFTVKFDCQDSFPGVASNDSPPLSIVNNFGQDTDEVRSAIQFLVSKSKLKESPKEIMISLGLKETNGKNLKEIVKFLDEIL